MILVAVSVSTAATCLPIFSLALFSHVENHNLSHVVPQARVVGDLAEGSTSCNSVTILCCRHAPWLVLVKMNQVSLFLPSYRVRHDPILHLSVHLLMSPELTARIQARLFFILHLLIVVITYVFYAPMLGFPCAVPRGVHRSLSGLAHCALSAVSAVCHFSSSLDNSSPLFSRDLSAAFQPAWSE